MDIIEKAEELNLEQFRYQLDFDIKNLARKFEKNQNKIMKREIPQTSTNLIETITWS